MNFKFFVNYKKAIAMILRYFTFLFLIFGAASIAQAEPVNGTAPSLEKMASARKLIDATHAGKTYDDLSEKLIPVLMETMGKPMFQSEGMIKLEASKPGISGRIKTIMNEELGTMLKSKKESVLVNAAEFYAINLTIAEIDKITEFYNSEAGSKMVAIQPQAMQSGLEHATQSLSGPEGEAFKKRFQARMMAEIKK